MPSDTFRFCRKFLGVILSLSLSMISQRLQALKHKWTYRETISPKNVVVLGGSFCGLFLAKRFMETLPTGYRVVLIEKNSHFNYSFNFPRFSVMPGYEHQAFVPYKGFPQRAPAGIFKHIHGIATKITNDVIYLESGDKIEYKYLAVATGSSQTPPAKVVSSEKAKACSEMRAFQERIKAAKKIAVIGGGAVGIEMASDIKSFYRENDVTPFHSRHQLLPHFGRRLHDHVVEAFKKLGIAIVFRQRPQILPGFDGSSFSLLFGDGRTEEFDLIVCDLHSDGNILSILTFP
jgi:NADH dehydrogenase FAD-containing subunit